MSIYGEGGQASSQLNNNGTKFLLKAIPLMIVGVISYFVFRKDIKERDK
jgi:hypothetical protein